MSDYNSGRPPRRDYGYDDRPRTAASRPQGVRPQGGYARPQGARPQNGYARSQGARPQNGYARPQGRPDPDRGRPQGGYSRRPVRGRKRKSPRLFIFAAIAVVLIVALIIGISSCAGPDKTVQPQATNAPQTQNGNLTNATISQGAPDLGFNGATVAPDGGASDAQYSTLADRLADPDAELEALDASQQVQVEDLSITPNLPSEWMNVLLLGADQRYLTESSRTDAILICSINTKTGEVKLSSILRDTQVELEGLPKEYGKNFRINSINYFGGPKYVMKYINQKLNMNIQYYVMVNFYGFSKIASALGGIDIDVTEAEMEEINYRAIEQAYDAQDAGVDESDLEAAGENVLLETFGKNTHLNGRQTLAYARIRHLDSDASRTDRQRKVLTALLNKVKSMGVGAIAMIPAMFGNVTTNMDMDAMAKVAAVVLQSGASNVKTLRLPLNNTYKQETRNEQSMLWDPDWKTNANELYNFIYMS